MHAAQADDLLVERRDERRLAALLQRREVLADLLLVDLMAELVDQLDEARASAGFASRSLGLGGGCGFGSASASAAVALPWLRRRLAVVRGLARGLGFGLRLRGSTATSSEAPQSFAPRLRR